VITVLLKYVKAIWLVGLCCWGITYSGHLSNVAHPNLRLPITLFGMKHEPML